MKAYREWKAKNHERGNAFHQAHIENCRIIQQESMEAKQRDIINSMRNAGRTDEEIDAYIEKWVEGIKAI